MSKFDLLKKEKIRKEHQKLQRILKNNLSYLTDEKFVKTRAQKEDGRRELEKLIRQENMVYKTFDGLTTTEKEFDALKRTHKYVMKQGKKQINLNK